MNFMSRGGRPGAIILFLAFLTNATAWPALTAEKITPEEVVAKHLEAIGPAETRDWNRSRIVSASSTINLKTGGRGVISGPALIASHKDKVLVKAEFGSPNYPFEKFSFDGEKMRTRQYTPGVRSPLAEFFMSHNTPFSEGLIGGTLSTAWPLLHVTLRAPKLQYAGTAKIDGRQAHKLKYTPHKGGELKITLFFDAETFHHLRTEYEQVIAAPMGENPGQSASLREQRFKLVEDFRDFSAEDGLTLPHRYTIQYTIFRQTHPLALDWSFDLAKFTFEYPIKDDDFIVDN